MHTSRAVAALNGLGPEELGDVAGQVLERLAAASQTAPGAADATLRRVLAETLDRLGAVALAAGMDDDGLTASVVALQRAEARVAGEKLRRVGELDARKAYRGKALSTADWLAPHLGLSRGEARSQADTAAALGRLPRTAERLRAGDLGMGQARQAARGLQQLDRLADAGGRVPADAAARLDDHVAATPPGQTAGQVARRVDTHLHAQAPDTLAERERRAHAHRRLWIGPPTPDGTSVIEGRLDVPGRAVLVAALDALSRPTGPDDPRTSEQRRHDALAALAERCLDAGDLPEVAAQRPHVILTATAALHDQPGAPPCHLDGHGPVSSATARMVACDGEITEVVMDPRGRPLQVRETGRPTTRQRRAVLARDTACIGCGAPATRCHLHHVRWRRHGGGTTVANLTLVCWACHHAIHHDHWTVDITERGPYTLHPPAGREPARASRAREPATAPRPDRRARQRR